MKKLFWIVLTGCLIEFVTLVGCGIVSANSLATPTPVTPTIQPSLPTMSKSTGKLSTRLEMLAQSSTTRAMNADDQARALSLPVQGPGSLMRDAQGRVLVRIRVTDAGDKNVQALRNAGVVIVDVSAQYQTITGFVAPPDLQSLANLSFVHGAQEELTPGTGTGAMPPPPTP